MSLFSPWYVFQPVQILRRLRTPVHSASGLTLARLPWGLHIEVDGSEHIGAALIRNGVYDLPLTETLWRLSVPGTLMVDVGANLGYTAALLAERAQPGGSVWAYEPHPEIFKSLQGNVQRMKARHPAADVVPRCVALSQTSGEALLHGPAGFGRNQGLASLEPTAGNGMQWRVSKCTLDEELGGRRVHLLKIDTEGHELAVLQGARQALAERRIEHIVLEAHEGPQAPPLMLLAGAGYEVFRIGHSWWGPRLLAPADSVAGRVVPNYLATLNATRALALFRGRGWQVFRP